MSLVQKYSRIGKKITIKGKGEYQIFRETVNTDNKSKNYVTLTIGFRFRLLGKNPLLHGLFQKLCILSLPLWAFYPGFIHKLWLVDPKTKNYVGLYKWDTPAHAESYRKYLTKMLNFTCTPGSIWSHLVNKNINSTIFW